MPRKWSIILAVIASLSTLYGALGILDVLVSLQYETTTSDCISAISGRDLCHVLKYWQWGTACAGLLTVLLIILPYKATDKQ